MLPVAEERKKVLIVEPAVADSITGDKWNRYIFRTGRSSYQDALAGAARIPASGDVSVGMLGLDTAFGRDGVAAFKAGAGGRSAATSRSSPRNTRPATRADFAAVRRAPVQRAEGQAGHEDHRLHLGRRRIRSPSSST